MALWQEAAFWIIYSNHRKTLSKTDRVETNPTSRVKKAWKPSKSQGEGRRHLWLQNPFLHQISNRYQKWRPCLWSHSNIQEPQRAKNLSTDTATEMYLVTDHHDLCFAAIRVDEAVLIDWCYGDSCLYQQNNQRRVQRRAGTYIYIYIWWVGVERFAKSMVQFASRFCGQGFHFVIFKADTM